jgi:hypothetical protein
MEDIITRHLINPDMMLYEHDVDTGELTKIHTRDDFCQLIDRWKIVLVDKYNVQPGETICPLLWPSIPYYALVFAAAELGLTFIVGWPHCMSERDLQDYKVAMWGQIDYVVVHSDHHNPDHPKFAGKWEMARNLMYGKNIMYEEDLYNYDINQCTRITEIINTISATPDTDFLWSSSSGTTGLPKKLIDSHKKCYRMGDRLCGQLFKKNVSVMHVENIHHGASLCYYFLPAFMVGGRSYTPNGLNGIHGDTGSIDPIIKFVVENKITQVFMFRTEHAEYFLENMPRVDFELNLITLLQITPKMVRLMKEKNVNWIKTSFGDTTIGMGFLTKHVDQLTDEASYDVANMGPLWDDFWQLEVRDGQLWIACQNLEQDWKTSGDAFEIINGDFYFGGRANTYRIGLQWIALNEIEAEVRTLFGLTGANIVVDPEWQKVYLAIWEPNTEAEAKLHKFFDDRYDRVKIDYVLRDEKHVSFFNGRKIDNSKIRAVCRENILKGVVN